MVTAFSTSTAIIHAEDSQPNESINKRNQTVPPLVVSTTVPLRRAPGCTDRGRGGRGVGRGGASERGIWRQHAGRGNKSWRARMSSRGGHGVQSHASLDSWSNPSGSSITRNPYRQLPSRSTIASIGRHDVHNADETPASSPPFANNAEITCQHPAESFSTASPSEPASGHHPSQSSRISLPHWPIIRIPASPVSTAIPSKPISNSRPFQSSPKLVPSPSTSQRHSPSPSPKRRRLNSVSTPATPPASVKKGEGSQSSSLQTPLPSTSTAKHVKIKHEQQSPSPPSDLPHRSLVTSGCSRYAPVPPECDKSSPNYRENRQKWIHKELAVLKSLGLKLISKPLVRDDGMVLEWTSPVPVWSDTLLPEPLDLPSAIERAHLANTQLTEKYRQKRKKTTVTSSSIPSIGVSTSKSAETVDINTFPTPNEKSPPLATRPPIILPRRRLPIPKIPPLSTATESISARDSMSRNLTDGDVTIVREIDHDPPESRHESDLEVNNAISLDVEPSELEQLALDYLNQYIVTFDQDRSALAAAYAQNALFSCRIHDLVTPSTGALSRSKAELFVPQNQTPLPAGPIPNTGVKQTCSEIIKALLSLGPHKFCPSGITSELDYDMLYLSAIGILLTCHGEVIDPMNGNHRLSVDQSFILCRKVADEEDESTKIWPLVAISHQMTVRDLSQLPPSKLQPLRRQIDNQQS